MENNNLFFWLEIISNILQIASYEMLIDDSTNNDIMKELQNQDNMLNEQTTIYLKKLVEQNEEILRFLKGEK